MRARLAGGSGGKVPKGWGMTSSATCPSSPSQDPDLEAKRKAELAKIKQKNRRFKEQVEHTLQQQASRAGRRRHPARARPEARSASVATQGPA